MMVIGVGVGVRPAGSVVSPSPVAPNKGLNLFDGGTWETIGGDPIEAFE